MPGVTTDLSCCSVVLVMRRPVWWKFLRRVRELPVTRETTRLTTSSRVSEDAVVFWTSDEWSSLRLVPRAMSTAEQAAPCDLPPAMTWAAACWPAMKAPDMYPRCSAAYSVPAKMRREPNSGAWKSAMEEKKACFWGRVMPISLAYEADAKKVKGPPMEMPSEAPGYHDCESTPRHWPPSVVRLYTIDGSTLKRSAMSAAVRCSTSFSKGTPVFSASAISCSARSPTMKVKKP
mmetsp:Transcript_14398/g.45301  ORF Transcript_14398/g.45301 Transcript_14398/m.45301 type:complete len:233 (+) Transcript_14398:82-780(+)